MPPSAAGSDYSEDHIPRRESRGSNPAELATEATQPRAAVESPDEREPPRFPLIKKVLHPLAENLQKGGRAM
jgi:hypothetical protein